MFRFSFGCFFATLLLPVSCIAADLSVHGIRLGMSPSEVANTIGPGFNTVQTIKYSNIPEVITGLVKRRPDGHNESFAFVYLNDKVVSVTYLTKYQKGKAPTDEGFQAALAEKYGPAKDVNSWFWRGYDNAGNLNTDFKIDCLTLGSREGEIVIPPPPFDTGTIPLGFPSRWKEGCGTHLEVRRSLDENHVLISSLVLLTNDDPSVEAVKQAAHRAENASQAAHDAAKGNKPAL